MPWIPESERTTAWYLFNEKYLCMVPYLESRTPEDIRLFGMPHTGLTEYDMQTANELVERLLTINQIMEYHDAGIEVRVLKRADTKKIYDRIRDHLVVWDNYLKAAFDVRGAPMDDLIKLDALAQTIYPYAKPYITSDSDSVFSRYLKTRRNRASLPIRQVVKEEDTPPETPDEYRGFARTFAELRRQRS